MPISAAFSINLAILINGMELIRDSLKWYFFADNKINAKDY